MLLLFTWPAFGQELETAPDSPAFLALGTDRPGNGNAATVVPSLQLQLETSTAYVYDSDSGNSVHQVSFPTMLRFGLLGWMELRLGSALLGLDASQVAHLVSSTDTSVGAKFHLLDNDGLQPDLAVMSDVYLPTGSYAFSSTVVVPEARAAAFWALPSGFGLLLNAGLDVPEDERARYARFIHVVNLGYTPDILQQRLTIFVESFGRTSLAAGRGPVMQVDAGIAFMVARKVQLDLFTQHGLTAAAPLFQVSLGFSTRF